MRFDSGGSDAAKKPRKKRGVSFYAAIVLCVTAVVLAVATDRMNDGEVVPDERSSGGSVQLSDAYGDALAVDETAMNAPETDGQTADAIIAPDVQADAQPVTTAASTSAPTTSTTAPAQQTQPQVVQASASLTFRMPTDGGEVSSGYSGDELIYCATMCDWRVHNGIDIPGKEGAKVYACADGLVEGFATDILYGNTAIIRHSDDTLIYYCGLSDTQMVSAGLAVKAGDVIGYIGEVPCELADGSHIHLVAMKNGIFIDPAALIKGSAK